MVASKEEKEPNKVQMCMLQATHELTYSFMKLAQVEVIMNFVRGR